MVLPQVIAESVVGDIESGQSEAEDRRGMGHLFGIFIAWYENMLAQTLRFLQGWMVHSKKRRRKDEP